MTSRRSRERLWLFLTAWIAFGLSINNADLRSYGLQHAGVEAIVQYRTYQLGFSTVEELQPRGDTFNFKGKILAAKQPGQFTLGAVPYFILSRLGITYESDYLLAARLVTFFSASLISAAGVAILYSLIFSVWQFSRPISYLTSLSYGLTTTILPYSGIAHHDVIAASLLIIAFYLIEKNKRFYEDQKISLSFFSGLLLGLTVFTSMLAALAVCVLLVFSGCNRQWRAAFTVATGFIIGIFPLGLYNAYYLGTPLGQSYFEAGFKEAHTFSFNNIGTILHQLNFYFGWGWSSVFKYMPVVTMGMLGYFCMGERFRKEKALFFCIFGVHSFYLVNMATYGHCQYGPRYLLPVIPFMMMGLAFLLEWARADRKRFPVVALVFALLIYSFAVNLLGALYGTMYCDYDNVTAIVSHFKNASLAHKGVRLNLLIFFNIGLICLGLFWRRNKLLWLNGPGNKSRSNDHLQEGEIAVEFQKTDSMPGAINSGAFSQDNNQKRYFICIITLIAILNIFRFMNLEDSPPGFFIDEAATAVCIQCLATEGVDSLGTAYPFFSQLGFGTPRPPTLLYLGLLWTKLFGFSITSFRALSAFMTVMTIAGLYVLGKHFFNRRMALFVTLAASLSPWAFQFSRIAWEAPLAPCFMIWGLVAFLHARNFFLAAGSGLLMACAMYSYPPAKAQIPLLVVSLLVYKRLTRELNVKTTAIILFSLVAACIPLIQATAAGIFKERFSEVIIFSKAYMQTTGQPGTFFDGVVVFVNNLALYLNPDFLFFRGDPNLRHSSQYTGEFSWLDTAAILFGIGLIVLNLCAEDKESVAVEMPQRPRRGGRDRAFIVFVLANILFGIVPAALTDTGGMPHALRSIGAWPFVSLLTGYILWKSLDRWPFVLPWSVVGSFLFAFLFLQHYFFVYPGRAGEYFDAPLKQSVLMARTVSEVEDSGKIVKGVSAKDIWERIIWRYYPQHQGILARYYLMNYHGQSCSESREPFLRPRGLFSSMLSAAQYLNLGNRLMAQGESSEAIKHYQAAVSKDPQVVEAYQRLGDLWLAQGDESSALRAYTRAYEVLQSSSDDNQEDMSTLEELISNLQSKMPDGK